MSYFVNFILFQLGWFATVLCVANQLEYAALFAVLGVIVFHLLLVNEKSSEIILILIAGITGLIIDSTLIANEVISAIGDLSWKGLAPLWLITLWMLFAITLNHSLNWLRKNYYFAGAMGFIFAPIAYFAGHNFGVLSFPGGESVGISLLIIGFVWAVITPLLLFISRFMSAGKLSPINQN